MSFRQLALSILLIFSACSVSAGEIQLTNGDRLAGELVSISESDIIWNSGTVGNIKISKDKIRAITSSTPLKIRGRSEPCHWQELRGHHVIFSCANGELDFEPLFSLEKVTPYVTEVEEYYQHSGSISLRGSKFGGNVQQQDWVINSEFMMRYGDVRHTMRLDYQARSFADNPLTEMYQGRYYFDWYVTPRGYWQNDISALSDDNRGIEERYTYGTGFGYELMRSPVSLLSMELGARYEKTRFEMIPPINPDREYQTETALWRWGVRFNYKLPLEIDFRHQTQYFQPMDEPDEWRLESDTGFSMPLGFGISADVGYKYDYNNAPPEFTQKADSILRFGLNYSW